MVPLGAPGDGSPHFAPSNGSGVTTVIAFPNLLLQREATLKKLAPPRNKLSARLRVPKVARFAESAEAVMVAPSRKREMGGGEMRSLRLSSGQEMPVLGQG